MGSSESEIQDYIILQNSFHPFEPHKVFDLGIERITDCKLIGIVTTIFHNSKLPSQAISAVTPKLW